MNNIFKRTALLALAIGMLLGGIYVAEAAVIGGGGGITNINGQSFTPSRLDSGANVSLTTSTNPNKVTISAAAGSGGSTTQMTAIAPIVVAQFGTNATTSCPTCIATNTGNWAGTWQGVNSTTFYLASNPSGFITTTNTNSLYSSATTQFYIDGNRGDTYTVDGSILRPYKTFSAALASSTGLASLAYWVAPGTYVEGAPLSFPSGTFQLIGNEATLVVPSGVSFNGPHDIYDITISGNVTENDTSTTNVHQWNNSVITGNFTANGLTTMTGMTFPTKGTVMTVATGTNLTALNNYFANSFVVNAGMANLDGIGIFASTTSPVIKVNAGGQLTMNGGTIFNYGGPGIDVSASGATSTPNEISNVSIVVLATSNTSSIYCGTSSCLLSDLAGLVDLTGGFHAPSGTVWATSHNENKVIFNSFSFGTSTMTNGQSTFVGALNQSAGLATLASTTVNGSLTLPSVTSSLHLADSNGVITAYGGAAACSAGQAVTTISAVGGTTCAAFGSSNVSTSSANTWSALQTFTGGLTANSTTTFNSSTIMIGSVAIGTSTLNGALNILGAVNQAGGVVSLATTTITGQATTTGLTVTGVTNALHLGTSTGAVVAYGGSTTSGGANCLTSVTVSASGTLSNTNGACSGGAGGSSSTFPVAAKTAAYTITSSDFSGAQTIVVNATTSIDLTLPTSSVTNGQFIFVKNNGQTSIFLVSSVLNLDNASSVYLIAPHNGIEVVSDGTNFETVGNTGDTQTPASRRWGYASANGGTLTNSGLVNNVTQGTAARIDPTATEGALTQLQTTAAATGTNAYATDNRVMVRMNSSSTNLTWAALAGFDNNASGFTNQRAFVSIDNGGVAQNSMLNADVPAIDMYGFRCSTGAGDTNWMMLANNSKATVSVVSTTVACGPATHVFSGQEHNATEYYYIDGAYQGCIGKDSWCAVSTTTFPTANTASVFMAGDQTINATGTKNVKVGYYSIIVDR